MDSQEERLPQAEENINTADQEKLPDPEEYSLPLSARRERGWEQEWKSAGENRSRRIAGHPQAEAEQMQAPEPEMVYRDLPADEGFSVRALTESAMMIAISVILGLLSIYVPFLSLIGLLLYPLPMTILTLRRGVKVGIAGTMALFGLSVIFFGIAQAAVMLIEYGVLGLFMGYCFRHRRKPMFTLAVSTVIAAVGTIFGILLSLQVAGLPFSDFYAQLEEILVLYMQELEAQGLAEQMLNGMDMETYMAATMDMMTMIMPAIFVITGMTMTTVCYLISGKILRRMRYDIPLLPPFAEWRMDWRFLWILAAGLGIRGIGATMEIDWLISLGMNLLYVICPMLVVCGISMIFWWLKRKRTGKGAVIMLVFLLMLFFSLAFIFSMVLAVLESVFHLREKVSALDEARGKQQKKNYR